MVTYHIQPHGKSALPCSVFGHTLVHAGVVHCDDLYDEWVHPFLTHQKLVVVVGADGFTVQVPADIWSRQASNLSSGKTEGVAPPPFYSPYCRSVLLK